MKVSDCRKHQQSNKIVSRPISRAKKKAKKKTCSSRWRLWKMKDREESSGSSGSTKNNPNGEHEQPREINIRPFSSVPSSPRNASSKYDFVKVSNFFFCFFFAILHQKVFEFMVFFLIQQILSGEGMAWRCRSLLCSVSFLSL